MLYGIQWLQFSKLLLFRLFLKIIITMIKKVLFYIYSCRIWKWGYHLVRGGSFEIGDNKSEDDVLLIWNAWQSSTIFCWFSIYFKVNIVGILFIKGFSLLMGYLFWREVQPSSQIKPETGESLANSLKHSQLPNFNIF